MKVLSVNKFYYLKGGSESCFFALNDAYSNHGIEVIPFSMKGKKNVPSAYEEYFVDPVDYTDKSICRKALLSLKTVYSIEAAKKIGLLAGITRPDIAHLHVFQHQLSPSIVHRLSSLRIPMVNTVHDLKPLCPVYTMYNHGEPCEQCRGHRYLQCVHNRCMKNSRAASIVAAIEMYFHRILRSYDLIDAYVSPSLFFRQKFIEYGFSPLKVHHIPNSIDCKRYEPKKDCGDYFLYFGRLSAEKGIMTLLRAMRQVKRSVLVLAGDGPLKEACAAYIQKESLENVHMTGFVTGKDLLELIQNCRFSILPSQWYENAPMSVLESMACGRPVIGARIGGIPEMITDGESGLLFEPGCDEQLAESILFMLEHSRICSDMGKRSRLIVEHGYNPEENFKKTITLYNTIFTNYGRSPWNVSSY